MQPIKPTCLSITDKLKGSNHINGDPLIQHLEESITPLDKLLSYDSTE